MRWKRLISDWRAIVCFALMMLTAGQAVAGGDDNDSLRIARYEQRLKRRSDIWNKLIPSQIMMQYAGGAGMFSVGVGWNYGKSNQWETHFSFGFIPRDNGHDAYWTMNLREVYMPWRISIRKSQFDFNPFTVSLGINTLLHGDFWASAPSRYPDGYYGFPTKLRVLLGVGQRVSFHIPRNKRRLGHTLSLYYDVSTCDLYVRQKILNSSIKLKDIIILGVGVVYSI